MLVGLELLSQEARLVMALKCTEIMERVWITFTLDALCHHRVSLLMN
jgi:hypothetical protein